MTIRNPADTVRLKNEILRGVYDENLRINNELPDVHKDVHKDVHTVRRRNKRGNSLFLMASILVLTLSFFLVRLLPFTDTHDKEQPLAATAVEAGPLPITTAEVNTPVQDPAYAGQTSFILRPQDYAPVEFNTQRLLDYSLILNDGNIRLSSVFGLNVQTIVIDPGHGGRDPGAIGIMGTQEKDIVLDIARRLREKLMQSGRYNIILTRDSDSTMSLAERVELANSGRTDLFISLHINALPQERVNLIETYYYGPPTDAETLRLAEQENRGSGILTSDFENMIKKIGNTFKEQESATLASSIQHSLFTNVKKYDKDTADAGTKIAPFVVLLGVDAPSVLVEISCISKKQEELKLNLPAYREEITSFLAEGTTRYLARRNLQVVKGEENDQKARGKSKSS